MTTTPPRRHATHAEEADARALSDTGLDIGDVLARLARQSTAADPASELPTDLADAERLIRRLRLRTHVLDYPVSVREEQAVAARHVLAEHLTRVRDYCRALVDGHERHGLDDHGHHCDAHALAMEVLARAFPAHITHDLRGRAAEEAVDRGPAEVKALIEHYVGLTAAARVDADRQIQRTLGSGDTS